MGSVKVLSYFGYWDVKVKREIVMKDPHKEMDEQAVSRILIGGKLNLHSPKFYSPANLIINWYF
jgi:hypothetical protein